MNSRTKDLILIGIGFLGATTFCILLNWHSFVNDQCAGLDCRSRLGFPLPFYERGGWAYAENIRWAELGADILFCLSIGSLTGWIIRFLWRATRP